MAGFVLCCHRCSGCCTVHRPALHMEFLKRSRFLVRRSFHDHLVRRSFHDQFKDRSTNFNEFLGLKESQEFVQHQSVSSSGRQSEPHHWFFFGSPVVVRRPRCGVVGSTEKHPEASFFGAPVSKKNPVGKKKKKNRVFWKFWDFGSILGFFFAPPKWQ